MRGEKAECNGLSEGTETEEVIESFTSVSVSLQSPVLIHVSQYRYGMPRPVGMCRRSIHWTVGWCGVSLTCTSAGCIVASACRNC